MISAAKPQASTLPVLEWLVRADLLLEDAPIATVPFDAESTVRPAFERLGDFLIASELMEGCERTGIDVARQPGGALYALVWSALLIKAPIYRESERNPVFFSVAALCPRPAASQTCDSGLEASSSRR